MKLSTFDDFTLIQLVVERGVAAIEALPPTIRHNKQSVAETIENNLRKVIIDKSAINPKYYQKMSDLLDNLIQARKEQAFAYEEYWLGRQFVPKVALVASKSFLICHSERNEESLACKQEIPRFSRNDKSQG